MFITNYNSKYWTKDESLDVGVAVMEEFGSTSDEADAFRHYYRVRMSLQRLEEHMRDDGRIYSSGKNSNERIGFKDFDEKELWEDLWKTVKNYEDDVKEHPIYDKVKFKWEDKDLPNFVKYDDDLNRTRSVGWFMDRNGDLFYYSESGWRNTPPAIDQELTFLGDG